MASYMTGTSHPATATATVFLLSLPLVGNPLHSPLNHTPEGEYRALGEVGPLVAQAVSTRVYTPSTDTALFSLLSDVASVLLSQARSVESDIAEIVDREFWKLLQ